MILNKAHYLLINIIRLHKENGYYANTNLIKCLKIYCENEEILLQITPAKLRNIILHWINQGYSDDQIVDLMVKGKLIIERPENKINSQKTEYLPFAYHTLAIIIGELTKIGKALDTRIILHLIPNNLITIGQSTKGVGHAEHIVPRVLVAQEASKMFELGETIENITAMLEKNLKVVQITKEEAKILDHKLPLKTVMPDGWKFGHSIFARLDAAPIDYTLYNS